MAPFYTGNHRPNAFAAVVGPDLPRDVRMDGRSILDVAPTILAAFAIDKPDYMEGTAFSEMRRPTDVGPSR